MEKDIVRQDSDAGKTSAAASPPFPFLKRGTVIGDLWGLCDQIVATAPPVFWTENLDGAGGGWVVTDGREMRRRLARMENLSTKAILSARSASRHQVCPVPSISDDPDHAFYKGLANPLFVPKPFTVLDHEIRAEVRRSVSQIVDADCWRTSRSSYPSTYS